MRRPLPTKPLATLLTLLLCAGPLAGCYNAYTIDKTELSKLQSGQEADKVTITSTGSESVEISPETPLEVQVNSGETYRITPFNFLLNESQLVSPDYDLLLLSDAVQGATVREISYGKTFGLIGGVAAAVAAGFVVLAVTQ
jgi:hypothetical protein